MTDGRGPRAQRWASALVLVVAAVALIATSKEATSIDDLASGSLELEPGSTSASLRLTVVANEALVDIAGKPHIPWSGSITYSFQTTGEEPPRLGMEVQPLPEAEEPTESPPADDALFPEHPEPCLEGAFCKREYLVTFRLEEPTNGGVTIDWRARVLAGWGDDDEPGDVQLRLTAEGPDAESQREAQPAQSELAALVTADEGTPTAVYELRFVKAQGVSPGPQVIEISSPAEGGGRRAKGRLELIPEKKGDPVPEVGVGRVTHFNPFTRCRREDECTVGYRLRIHAARKEWWNPQSAQVFFRARERGVSVHQGGVVFERRTAHIDSVYQNTDRLGQVLTYELQIDGADRIPAGTPIEVEARYQATLIGLPPKAEASSESGFASLRLPPGSDTDAGTGILVQRCTHPCTELQVPSYQMAGGVINWTPILQGPRYRYRLTARLRFIGLDEPPEGVRLEWNVDRP